MQLKTYSLKAYISLSLVADGILLQIMAFVTKEDLGVHFLPFFFSFFLGSTEQSHSVAQASTRPQSLDFVSLCFDAWLEISKVHTSMGNLLIHRKLQTLRRSSL